MDDAALIRLCLKGNEKAWERLIDRYGSAVYSLCFHFTGNAHDAEDLTQDVFLKVYTHLDSYQPPQSFLAWAMRIAKNHCIDVYRAQKARKRLAHVGEAYLHQLETQDNPLQEVMHKEKVEQIFQALHELPETTTSLILMRDLLGLSYQELSSIFGIPEGTVKSRLNRGRLMVAQRVHQNLKGKNHAAHM